jgi:hypothetical protein
MSTTIKWNASESKEVHAVSRPRWGQVRQGFVLAVMGHTWFVALAMPGLFLLGPLGWRLAYLCSLELDDTLALGLLLLGAGTLVGYGLVLVGQWRCLTYAPQGHGAKELQFACLLCTLIAPPCFVVAYYLGGAELYPAIPHDPAALRAAGLLSPAVVFPVAGLVLALVSSLLFSGYARAVGRYLRDPEVSRRVAQYFWFVLFLVGGTAGMVLEMRRSYRLEGLVVMTGAGFVCVAWHALVIRSAARSIARMLAKQRSGVRPALAAQGREQGQVSLQAASYFRSVADNWK